jgi:predicted DNA-binding transcriptional regulator AlpA
MSSDASLAPQAIASASSRNVVLSPWVNEPLPAWEELLTAHCVARLTRRPRWVLVSLVLLGRFPRKCRYHGRGVGWLRSDVLSWRTKELEMGGCRAEAASIARRRISRQGSLPLECAYPCTARRGRGPCCPSPTRAGNSRQ